jgi:MSV199 domain
MENYYSDRRVLYALEKSSDGCLMDILTFVKEIDFEIKDNLGFDVLWDSMNGRQFADVRELSLNWMGYTNQKDRKRDFIQLLESNEFLKVTK